MIRGMVALDINFSRCALDAARSRGRSTGIRLTAPKGFAETREISTTKLLKTGISPHEQTLGAQELSRYPR